MAAVAFDMNGTFLDPSALAEPLGGDDDARRLVQQGLDAGVEQALTLAAVGEHRPFSELVRSGIARALLNAGRDPAAAEQAVERASQMAPFPEAADALDVLRGAGLAVAAVTNSAGQTAEQALERAGLRDRFSLVLGSDESGAFKPDPRVYRLAAERLGERPQDLWLVAVHTWDVLGAGHAGLRTAWIARKEGHLASAAAVDVEAADLLDAARQIAAR